MIAEALLVKLENGAHLHAVEGLPPATPTSKFLSGAVCPEKGVWKPGSKKLTWGRATLKSSISAGYPGGHILLDHIVRAAMPWVDPKLKNHLSNGESLFYENVGMRVNKVSDKVDIVCVHSKKTAEIDKDVFLKLIDDLREDFFKASKSATVGEVSSSTSKDLPDDGNHSRKRKCDQHKLGNAKAREQQAVQRKSPRLNTDAKNNTDAILM